MASTRSKETKSLAALKRRRTLRLAKLLSRALYLHRRGRDEQMYNVICDEFVDMGGVYIKFLQGVLLNSPIMKKWHSPNRLRIFENVESETMDIVQILRSELPPERLAQIALVQPKPFAAGSFGQVYYGQHVNGKNIIIKVLRPQIRELLKHDLRLLGIFSKRFVGREYPNISVKMNSAIREFRIATLRETDYVTEAEFARELFEVYKDHPTMTIPETYLDLCTPHMIVQDYLGGVSVVDVIRLKQEQNIDPAEYVREQTGSDLDKQLETLGTELVLGVFNLPRIQGDPHPGNIRLLPDNKVGMIDFGISAHAPTNKAAFFGIVEEWAKLYEDSDNIVSLFEQFMRFFVTDLYKALKKLSSVSSRASSVLETAANSQKQENSLTREVGRMMQQIMNSAIGTRDVREFLDDAKLLQVFNNMVNRGNRFGLVMRLESSEILRAAQTYMTLVDALGRRKVVLPNVFRNVVKRVEIEHPEIRTEGDEPMSITEALETINRWLERVAMRDPALFEQLMRKIRPEKAKKAKADKVKTAEKPNA